VTAGYSGKPLAKKLDVKPNERWLLVNAPKGFEATLGELPAGASTARTARAGVDGAVLFVKERAMLARSVARVQERIGDGGALWVAWPKKASGVPTDVTEDVLREVLLPTGWVDTKVCAVDETWSGLKFLRRVNPSDKPGRPTAAEVETPAELRAALAKDKAAKKAFDAMPPSHRREHAKWVGEAKKTETREKRAAAAVEKVKAWASRR